MRCILLVGAALLASGSIASSALAGGDKPKPPPAKPPAPPAMSEPRDPPAMDEPTPAADPDAKPAGKNWSAHTGNLKFVVGYDEGMEQAWVAGRPAMLFFTSSK